MDTKELIFSIVIVLALCAFLTAVVFVPTDDARMGQQCISAGGSWVENAHGNMECRR